MHKHKYNIIYYIKLKSKKTTKILMDTSHTNLSGKKLQTF